MFQSQTSVEPVMSLKEAIIVLIGCCFSTTCRIAIATVLFAGAIKPVFIFLGGLAQSGVIPPSLAFLLILLILFACIVPARIILLMPVQVLTECKLLSVMRKKFQRNSK